MWYRVIISHHQSRELYRFPVEGCKTIVVLDDPTDEDFIACNYMKYDYIVVESSGNRGANRNAGLKHIFENYSITDDDIVEFMDGDRYPVYGYSLRHIHSIISSYTLDCLLYACETDTRIARYNVPKNVTVPVDTGTLSNPFYSCGFAMSIRATLSIMGFNGGNLFEPSFKSWGCEDQYIGILCSHLGIKVGLTTAILLNGSVGGDATRHPLYKESLQTYIDLIRTNGFRIVP